MNATYVLCPVGLRIVKPWYVPPYVHMFVHGPSRICTHTSLMPIETFAFVFTGGKTIGCEKPAGVSGAFEVAVAVAFGALVTRMPIAARAAPTTSANKALRRISLD